jgi:hypothetical protein
MASAGPPRDSGRYAEPIQSPVHTSHTYKQSALLYRLATNNTETELIVAVHANILSPTGPGLATEPPRYRRVATAPRPALVPNIPRLCRFSGREAGFGAQRGFCRPPINKRYGLLWPVMIVLPRTRDRELVDCYHGGPHREISKVLRLVGRLASCCAGCFFVPGAFWRRHLGYEQPNEDR